MKIPKWISKLFSTVPSFFGHRWPGRWGGGEHSTGDWQKDVELDHHDTLLRNSAVYACVTGIASDIGKLRIKLCRDEKGITKEIRSGSPFLPVLRKPNHYQNRIMFLVQWILCKLLHGNAYIIKQRDNRGVVSALYVLDPRSVTPLVAEDGGVYYQLSQDPLSQLDKAIVAPASEIIHDLMPGLWHPLVGVPPIYACALSATLANRIQNDQARFFENRSLPGGMLSAPGKITNEVAERLKLDFEKHYSGENIGKLVVAGDGLKFEAMRLTAEASQVAEQFKLTTEDIARAFHYPMFKLGGPLPPYAGNTEALIISYYTDCLQALIECVELCLDEGLSLPTGLGTELDLDNLMRMDTAALYKTNTEAVSGGWMKPDEGRFRANLEPVTGGDTPYLQQQNYSLAALAKRDAREDPFATGPKTPGSSPPPAAPPPAATPAKELDEEDLFLLYGAELRKEFAA